MRIRVGTVTEYEIEQAKRIIDTYCFSEIPRPPKPLRDTYGVQYRDLHFPRFAYRTYDCVPPEPGRDLSPTDLLIAAGLNGQVDASAYAGLQLGAPQGSHHLQAIDEKVTFWSLPPESIDGPETGPPDPHGFSDSYHLHAAWSAMMQIPHVGVALTHKVLHHKRPSLFPLIDNLTLELLEAGNAWGHIHRDLTEQGDAFDHLESWFSELADHRRTRPLTRLRLHDILLWWAATSQGTPEDS